MSDRLRKAATAIHDAVHEFQSALAEEPAAPSAVSDGMREWANWLTDPEVPFDPRPKVRTRDIANWILSLPAAPSGGGKLARLREWFLRGASRRGEYTDFVSYDVRYTPAQVIAEIDRLMAETDHSRDATKKVDLTNLPRRKPKFAFDRADRDARSASAREAISDLCDAITNLMGAVYEVTPSPPLDELDNTFEMTCSRNLYRDVEKAMRLAREVVTKHGSQWDIDNLAEIPEERAARSADAEENSGAEEQHNPPNRGSDPAPVLTRDPACENVSATGFNAAKANTPGGQAERDGAGSTPASGDSSSDEPDEIEALAERWDNAAAEAGQTGRDAFLIEADAFLDLLAIARRLREERDQLQQHVCDECVDEDGNPTGWRENRAEGRYACACIAESEPYIALAEERDAAIARAEDWHRIADLRSAALVEAEKRAEEWSGMAVELEQVGALFELLEGQSILDAVKQAVDAAATCGMQVRELQARVAELERDRASALSLTLDLRREFGTRADELEALLAKAKENS